MDIEQHIRAVGADQHPRITVADIEAEIASEHYFTAAQGVSGANHVIHNENERGPLSLLTFCVLVLRNGFTVTGESACASPANFNAKIGQRAARDAAINKAWQLLGFRLRDKLAARPADFRDRVRRERAELDEKRLALAAFFGTPKFQELPADERNRLKDQIEAMRTYSGILSDRIDAFAD